MNSSKTLEALWIDFSIQLRSFIFSKVKNETDADDILQNVFIRIHNKLHTLDDESRIKPWIYQIARNMIIDYYRAGNRQTDFAETDLPASLPPESSMQEAVDDMIKMMNGMPPEYCEALCLKEIEGLSQKEYAERKGLSYSGAKSRVQRARIMLKEMLLQCCHYETDKYGTVLDIQPRCCVCCK